jgi:hypothetical protein
LVHERRYTSTAAEDAMVQRFTVLSLSRIKSQCNFPHPEVTIEVNATALPKVEHGNIEEGKAATSTTWCIEAPPATDFSIRYLFRLRRTLKEHAIQLRNLRGSGDEDAAAPHT